VRELIESHGENLQMKNSFGHKKIFCAQTEAEASEEPQLETKQFTMKEISLAFRDIAEGVERFKKKKWTVIHLGEL